MIKAIFVTNICPHYRVRTFETLAQKMNVSFLFFSEGGERYWDARHGLQHGDFHHEYLPGFYLTRQMRITPALVTRVWQADVDVIIKCITGRFALPVTYLLARARRKPFVLWTGLWSHPATFFHHLTWPLAKYIYTHADAIVVYGAHVRNYLIKVDVQPERIFIAPHAIDSPVYNRPVPPAERDNLRAELGLSDRRVVLYVGRLEESKGLCHLLVAGQALTDFKPVFVFVGTGALQDALVAQAKSAGLETRFLGYVPTEELYRCYAMADVFVLPSITTATDKEPWGLVVNEAMNQALPVVASNAVGAAAGGLIRHEETGLVFPERDVKALATALQRIFTEPGLARRLGEAGRQEVALWTNERMTDGFVSAAEYVLKRIGA
ncbi:MAG TPA: glycosyltransferase family 4 protein [Anaerolineales bacterium]|nr:glycosyltransferase family 4 protein [Anaerolineales bacterium]